MDIQNKTFSIRENETITKKNNMVYWDAIDNDAEDYVRNLIAYSYDDVDIDDDDIIVIAKDILELAVSALGNHGARFPYVDENY